MSQHLGNSFFLEIISQAGTLLAPHTACTPLPGRWSVQRVRRQVRLLVAMAWLLMMGGTATGCVTLPAVVEVTEDAPVVSILDDKVDPLAIEPTVVDRADPFADFSVDTAVASQNVKGPLYYSWYYDFDTVNNIPLPYYSLCGDSPRCLFSVCTRVLPTDPAHRLLLVVSDSKLNANPTDPVDFPEGAAFDTVQWQLSLVGVCPKAPDGSNVPD